MALAAVKTWQFTSRIYPYLNSTQQMQRDYHHGLKDILVEMGWTVEGGRTVANGLHNNDQVDVYPTNGSGDFGTGDVWMHLKAPVASPIEAEIAYGSTFSTGSPDNMYRMNRYISTSAGFGTANAGGTDGTTSTGPQSILQNVYISWGSSTTTVNQSTTLSMYGAWTTDNEHYRIMMVNEHVIADWLTFDVLANPRADLLDGAAVHNWRHAGGNTTTPNASVQDNDFYTSALYKGNVNGVIRSLYLGTPGYANAGLQSHNDVLVDQKMIVHPCDVYNNTSGSKGYMGTIPDLYYGNNNQFGVLLGDSVGGAANWWSGGSIITPWDPNEPRPRVH